MMEELIFAQEPLQNDDVKFQCLLLLAASRIFKFPLSSVPPYPASQMACIGQTQCAVPTLEHSFVAGSYLGILTAEQRGLLPSSLENHFKGEISTVDLCTDVQRHHPQMTFVA